MDDISKRSRALWERKALHSLSIRTIPPAVFFLKEIGCKSNQHGPRCDECSIATRFAHMLILLGNAGNCQRIAALPLVLGFVFQ
jgi:hypothetical protein